MAHPLLAPKKIARHVFVLVVIAGCVVAGFWQLARLHQVRAYDATVRRQIASPPQPIDRVVPPGSRVDPRSVRFRRVTATGTYDPRDEVVLAGRTRRDNPGNAVLTPLVLADGRTIIVNRGWVRFGMDRPNALAYLSAATDFDISQVVDLVKGVHARIRVADFDA